MVIYSALLALIGLLLLLGGGYLISLGGSIYYALAGLALLLTAWLVKRSPRTARLVYAALLVGTLIWSLWESGYYWWALATRLGMLLVLAIPLLLTSSEKRGKLILPVWAMVAVVSLGSILHDPFAIEGKMSTAEKITNADTGTDGDNDWYAYGRSNYGQRYSPLDQITTKNVTNLEQAWQYQTGDRKMPGDPTETTYQVTPIKVGDTLFVCTPHNWLIALDGDTGEKKWQFTAAISPNSQRQHQTCRGVSYQPPASGIDPQIQTITQDSSSLAAVQCDARIYMPLSDAQLLAVDPATGAVCEDFGADDGKPGYIDLTLGMPIMQSGYYYSTSPPLVVNGVVIVAGAVNDNYALKSPSGVIRGFDTKTGELLWNFDSGNPDDTAPIDIEAGETYLPSTPNSWSIASADAKLGLAYFPMGNRTPDQLGMFRSEAEETYATSVLALDISTGKPAWVQQFIHHDLWDMDTPAQPTLLDLKTNTGLQPALVIPTKQGDVYVLNRETGEPIFPITEEPAPQGTSIPGEHTAASQPSSALNFKPDMLQESDMWGATPLDQLWCRIRYNELDYEGQYTAPGTNGTLVYPGNFGVFNWGGIAVDPNKQQMFGMPLYLAFVSTLVDKDGKELQGETNKGEQGLNSNEGASYAVNMHPFLSPLGVPCQQPPWGYVAGVDLTTGKKVWQHKNGTIEDLSPLPLPIKMGIPGIGGPMITGSGVVFMAAAVDNYIRAYDLSNGEQLWQARLPAGGQATPMTYLNSKGEQIVFIAAGGHGSLGTTIGDYFIAYKLKK